MKQVINRIKSLFKVPMLLVFVLICLIFLPDAINMQSAVFRSAIVVALGMDYSEEEYVIHVAVNVSAVDESLSENTKLISARGNTVSDAISNLSIQFGRPIRLGHTRFVLIGTGFAGQNVALALDGLIRTNKMRDTVQLIVCDADVAEMLNIGIEIKNKTGIKMSEIIGYQSKYSTTAMDSNIDTFYKGYLSPAEISKLNCITLTDDYTKGITPEAALGEATSPQAPDAGTEQGGSSGQNAGGNSGQGAGQKKKKFVSSTGAIAIFKKGIMQTILPGEIADGTYWINTAYTPKKLNVFVKDSTILKNAHVGFLVLEKSVTTEVFFYKNIPMVSAKINVILGIEEIINNNNQIIPLSEDVIDQEVKCAVGRRIREETGNALKFGKETGLDVLDLNETFYLNKYKEYNKYLLEHTTENFIDNVQVSLEVRVEVI